LISQIQNHIPFENMTIRALQFWLFLIGLLVLIDDGTGLTNFDDALTMAINRPEVLLDARRGV
jgi:hypothetical protein